ncbi:adenine nucleotide transporter [Tricholoma matsutake]|nr:adenine nucleotide transporter [Tricholoma matsutake 945]
MPAQSKPVQQLTPYGAALAGVPGSCFSTAIVYPLEVAKTRIQAFPTDGKGKGRDNLSMMSVLLWIYRKESVSGLYRGFGATMLNTFSMQYAYFFFYSFMWTTYINRLMRKVPVGSKLPPLSTVAELLLGAIAGALVQIFTIPVSVIATRQQVGCPNQLKSLSTNNDSFLAIAHEIIEEEGVTGLWLGLKPGLVLTINPAITYGVFERVKGLILLAQAKAGTSSRLMPWMSFFIGAVSKTLATVVSTGSFQIFTSDAEDPTENGHELPLDNGGHHTNTTQVGALEILSRIWKHEGFVSWYQGMQVQITKAVLSQALLFMSKEQFKHWAPVIMIFIAWFSTRWQGYMWSRGNAKLVHWECHAIQLIAFLTCGADVTASCQSLMSSSIQSEYLRKLWAASN